MSQEQENRPLGRREERKRERRATIVAAARRSFLNDGYAATTMSGLLTTLGGSKATLWSYFRSKEELFAAVIEDVTRILRKQADDDLFSSDDIATALTSFCQGFMDRIASPDAVATWRLVTSESGRFPEVGRIFHEVAASRVERALADYIKRQIQAGNLIDEGAAEMSKLLLSMCTGQQTRLLLGVDGEDTHLSAGRYAAYFLRLFAQAKAVATAEE
jgi:TetR/AcrR family transcriptional repressor of mexJK operon